MMETYRTQSLYESAYLLTKGFSLAGKEKLGDKVTILFKHTPDIEQEVVKFYNGGEAEAKKLTDNYRTLKDYIFAR